jgi:hypothetical protein
MTKRIMLLIAGAGLTVAALITAAAEAGVRYHAATRYGVRY